MKRQVQLFIEGQRVELFKDEQISINSTIQNIKDLSKTFTDFTQSFSCPASPSNNKIFQHFYNSDVSFIEGNYINPNIRRFATLEIDNTFFRRGTIALEKANIQKNEAYSYTVTFYGDLVTLKDTFGETRFIDLDWSTLSFPYSFNSVKDRITDGTTDYDVRFPIIASERYYQYNNPSTPNENIDTATGAILFTELFPAVKLSAIIGVIETFFNITFQGGFLQDDRFKKAFMYFKNTVVPQYSTPPEELTFNSLYTFPPQIGQPLLAPPWPYFFNFGGNAINGATIRFDGANVTTPPYHHNIELSYVNYDFNGSPTDVGSHVISCVVNNLSVNAIVYIDVYRGIAGTTQESLYTTIELTNAFNFGGEGAVLYAENNENNPSINARLRFEVRTNIPCYLLYEIRYRFLDINNVPLGTELSILGNPTTTQDGFDLGLTAPEITVQDFLSNILSLFNLTCYGVKQNVYEIQTVEEWYNEGEIYNITEYTDTENIGVSRLPLFNTINYKYEQSESITNRKFASLFMREFGDLSQSFDFDGGQYEIAVEFENLQFSKFEGVPLQVGYCLDENLEGYVPKPIILYENQENAVNFYLKDGANPAVQLNSCVNFGQDMSVLTTPFSLNWGTENSTFTLQPNENGLYNTYYAGYIGNLYNPKNREYTVKAILPLSILTSFKLNDRFQIRDKRYIPNNVKINLTTAETTLVLVQDFRRMIADKVPPIFPPFVPTPDAQCFNAYIPFIKNAVQCDLVQCGTIVPGVTINPTTLTEPGNVEICIPEDESALNYLITEEPFAIQIVTENEVNLVLESSEESAQIITICLTYTLTDGSQIGNQIFIQRP